MSDSLELMQAAIQLHQRGQLDEARANYDRLLEQDPNHADALNLRGLVARQMGRHDEAIEYVRRAIALVPTQAAYHGNLAEAYRGLGRTEEAIACYQTAVNLQPTAAVAHINLAILLGQAGRSDEAIAGFRQAIAIDPNELNARYYLGAALEGKGLLADAMVCYHDALAIDPQHNPSLVRLAALHKQRGNMPATENLLRRAAAADPRRAQTHFDLGNTLQLQRKWAEAIECYRKALAIEPNYFEAYCNLANALREHGQLGQALACAERAIELAPSSPAAHSNLGVIFLELGRLAESQQRYEHALALDPNLAVVHNNLGTVLRDQGHVVRAVEHYERALLLDPTHAQARCSRGMALLSMGRFAEGWADYEHRVGLPQFDTLSFAEPRWDGGPLKGRTLLIHAEQGLGDTLQFIRFVKPAAARAAPGQVFVAAHERLIPLLRQSGFSGLTAIERALPPFDVHLPLLSLPGLLGVDLDALPGEIPYLAADAARIERWRSVIAEHEGFKVGIAWQGRPAFRGDRQRSMPLRLFEPLAQVRAVRLISLQRGPGTEQLRMLGGSFDVIDLGEPFDPQGEGFLDTAAVMKSLDLVITSDSAIAHLAGALGVPVWVALSLAPDWRWLLDRQDSPWYPDMRLFRQTRLGHWQEVFAHMAEELGRLVGG
jgi:tetratricopeptide (TPR) repeat protein